MVEKVADFAFCNLDPQTRGDTFGQSHMGWSREDFDVVFKPVATIMQDQQSVVLQGNATTVSGKGRHDPCVLPRAVPIVDAMAALVLVDFWLRNRLVKI